ASPTGKVIPSRVWSISDGHRKSFHDVTNVKIATAAIDGRTIGSSICPQTRHSPAPSTRAASIRSFGTPRNAWRIRKMLNALATLGKMLDGRLSQECKRLHEQM